MDLKKNIFPLMVIFNEDIKKNKGPSHITDLIILTTKSLLPSEKTVSVGIDYDRYKEEIKLWQYYRRGQNSSLINILGKIDADIYWYDWDDTLYYRLLPIILVNKDYDVIKREVIKNILFSTGNIEHLIEGLLLSKLIYCLILKKKDIVYELKEEVIKFSQVKFLEEYSKYFRVPLKDYKTKYTIAFEQNKIYALNILNLLFVDGYKTLEDCLKVLLEEKEANTTLGKAIEFYINDIENGALQLDDHYYEWGTYVYNLRNGRIDPKLLKINNYYLPDIFQFNKGEVFYHSLLNKSKVIERQKINGKTVVYLSTKSGIYRFINN